DGAEVHGFRRLERRHQAVVDVGHSEDAPTQLVFAHLCNVETVMLRELAVQNLAVIEDVRVELRPGFCVWTGETGAGKSLLLGALCLLLGERGSADRIRTGADELRITGRFELDTAELRQEAEAVLSMTLEDGEVIL